MSDNGSAQSVDLENWMRDLPEQLRNIPLIYLAIPGNLVNPFLICLLLMQEKGTHHNLHKTMIIFYTIGVGIIEKYI